MKNSQKFKCLGKFFHGFLHQVSVFCFSFWVIFLWGSFVWASFDSDLQKANDFYQKKEYQNAQALYLNLYPKLSYPSASFLYNLGQLYFNQNEWGKALFYYEKARVKSPRDAEVLNKIAILRSRIQGASLQVSFLESLIQFFSFNEIYVLFLSLGFFLWGCFYAKLYRYFVVKQGLYGVGGVMVFLLVFSGMKFFFMTQKTGIILQDSQVKSGLGDVLSMTLSSGSAYVVLEEGADFVEIDLGSGKTGWVSRRDIGLLP